MNRNSAFLTICIALILLVGTAIPGARSTTARAWQAADTPQPPTGQIEPQAGTWHTWVLQSGSQLRLPPPPDRPATNAELMQLRALAAQRDAAALDQIRFWDAGAPGYRWMELAINTAVKNNMSQPRAMRALTLLSVAIYDATIAAWDSKYAYHRPRPSELDHNLDTVLPTPASPSYPSEHAVAAGAAAQVLAYIFPADAQSFLDAANAAGRSRVLAGVQYPSDVTAGLALGHAVGDLVVARAKTDGSDIPWTGSVPTEPGHWTGTNPLEPAMGSWKTWALTSGSQFRPGPPPAAGSTQLAADVAELKNFAHTPATDRAAYFWQYPYPSSLPQIQYDYALADKQISDYRLDLDPPAAARVYALEGIGIYDGWVACWDAKYTYWAPRPNMVDPAIKTLFPDPPHPSYPSAHSCVTGVAAGVLGELFPREAARFTQLANDASESRLVAGIHFRSDIVAGLQLGSQVAAWVMQRAQNDQMPLPNTGVAGAPLLFPETGFSLDGDFLAYWQANGGLSVFGDPIDAARQYPSNGNPGRVSQWLERARFELHPENAAPYNVLLGRLGVEALARQGRDWQSLAKARSDAPHFVAATGHAIAEQFWDYWRGHGLDLGDSGVSERESLALFGYPISEPEQERNADGDTVLTQWFERARFEYHPTAPGADHVLLGRLGAEVQSTGPR